MQLFLRLVIAALITWLLLSSSGCTTVAVPAPHLQKPVTCLLPTPKTLATLPADFPAQPPETKARTLLTLHAADGAAFASVVAQLLDCQDFIGRLP